VSATAPEIDDRTAETIMRLLDTRGPDKTICPSDAARVLAGEDDFRPYMEPVREAAARLVDAGRIEVTQKGRTVTIADARGPIRLGLAGDPEDER
jgi:hypothetical protein